MAVGGGLLVGTAIFAVGQALSYPAAVLLAMETSSEVERSAVVGGVTAFVDVALGVGAFTLGAVAAVTGYADAFLISSVVSRRPARGSADAENWKDRGRGRSTVTEPCAT